jgi:hypothetical protein
MSNMPGRFVHTRCDGETETGRDAFLANPTGLFAGMIASFIPGIGPLIAAGPLAGEIASLSVGEGLADSSDR